MERIQYAIAKARAERADELGPPPGPDAAPMRVPPPPAGGTRHSPAPPAQSMAPSVAQPITPDDATQPGLLAEHVDATDARAAEEAAAFMHSVPKASEEEVEQAWRALGALTVNKRHAIRNRLVSIAGGTGAPEIDGIRTRLLQHAAAKGLRRIAITSPTPSCGKSTVAINLGFSLGRQSELRTIVADLDLRRPHMHKALGVKEKHSFARVLQGEAEFANSALRHGQSLAFAVTHESLRHPAELLQSRRTAQKIAEIEALYAPNLMIFDLPPLLVNDDAMAFLGHADACLIVAAAGKTTIKEIDRTELEVASQTKVLGIILNACRYMDGTDGYKDYYN